MFHLVCKTILHSRNGYSFRAHNPSMAVTLSLLRYLSTDADNQHSFTVNYLTNSCGLSPKSALMVSKNLQFSNPEKPDLILSFFGKHGFSKPQIADMIIKFPKFLLLDPQKVFPKVEFFLSKGVPTSDLVRIFASYPLISRINLKNKLVPNFNCLVEALQSEHKAIEAIKRYPRMMAHSFQAKLKPNLNTLREFGVPAANVAYGIRCHLNCMVTNPIKFRKTVEEVKEMGFNPLQLQFVLAIISFGGRTKSTRDKKVEVYKRWGWSDKDITAAFKKFPVCMTLSEDKIMAAMDFYVNQLGLESSFIANCPVLLGYSLKKRLIPRGEVIQFLCSKDLLKFDSRISTMFKCTEKYFLEKYVNSHEEAPHLINLYNDKLNEAINEEGRK